MSHEKEIKFNMLSEYLKATHQIFLDELLDHWGDMSPQDVLDIDLDHLYSDTPKKYWNKKMYRLYDQARSFYHEREALGLKLPPNQRS